MVVGELNFLKGSRIGSMNLSEPTILTLVHSSSTLAVSGAILYLGVIQGVVVFAVYLTIGVLLTQCLIHILLVYV